MKNLTAIAQDLQKIGLTKNQVSIYLALFELQEAKAGEIIKKTGLHRNIVYVALQDLVAKKLVSDYKEKGILNYRALSPTRLLANMRDQERIVKDVVENLSLLAGPKKSQEIIVYEGIDEFQRHILHTYTTAKAGSLIRYLGISPEWHDIVGSELESELISIQQQKKIKMKALAKDLSAGDLNYLKQTKGLTQIKTNRLISSDTNGIEITDDKIAIRSFLEPYFVVEITQKELAKNYQNYFDFLWKGSLLT